jgi:hypothetical protein
MEEYTEERRSVVPRFFYQTWVQGYGRFAECSQFNGRSGEGNIIAGKKISKGDEVVARPVDDRWAKKEGVENILFTRVMPKLSK